MNNKHALLIGIDKYPQLAARFQLSGCVNDVELMANVLRDHFGFPEENVVTLRDEQATREGILTAMDELLDCVDEDDVVVVHYSGHGSQMRDREGDEPDGFDETIVPHDSGRDPHPNCDISDDEIYIGLLLLTEKTSYVTLIFDCCHSGTISRDAFGANARWVEPDERPVEELPPSPIPLDVAQESTRDLGPSGWLPLGKRYVLIAGCRDEESSYEHRVDEIMHGALTFFLSQELLKATAGATYRDVFERASAHVTAHQPRQHPQMEGARDRELFGVRDVQPVRFVRVVRNGRRAVPTVILNAGAAHGMTVGSRWAVYPQATQHITEETLRLGLVEITSVHAVTSEAKIVEENGLIEEGTRAVEESHFYGEMRLKVMIQTPAGFEQSASELAEAIEKSALLRRVESGAVADVRIYLIPPRDSISQFPNFPIFQIPVPQLGAVAEATWAVVGLDGRLAMPPHAVSAANATFVLCDNLEKTARYRQALALKNANDDSPLKDKVEFVLKCQSADGGWVVAEPENVSGQIVFEEGDRIAAEIINRHDAPIYVSVLDFGITGAVSLVYPVEGASERLEPGKSIQIGVRDGEEIELFLPDNFPFVPDPNDTASVGGMETFKLFVTTHEADFSLLVQEGYRALGLHAAKGVDSPLGQLLNMALTGHGTRDVRRNRVPPDEEWTTTERTFFLRKRKL